MRASTCLSLAVCWSAVAFSSVAAAQSDPIGAGGRLILSADRLFGLHFSKFKNESDDGDVTTLSRTDVALLFRPIVNTPATATIPQIGLDVGVVGAFTLGGGLGFYSQSGENESTPNGGGTTISNDSPTITVFVLAPRAGYGIPIAPWLTFWPRLGLSYYNFHTSQTMGNGAERDSTFSGMSLNVDPVFVFIPVQHFGITAGPYLDMPLSGSTSSEVTQNGNTMSGPDLSNKYTEFGLKIGLLGAIL